MRGCRAPFCKREKIRLLLKELRSGTSYLKAIQNIGIRSDVTVWNWRNKPAYFSPFWHKRLNILLEKALEAKDEKRVQLVEDKLMERLMNDKSSSAEYIFFLTNRANHRWQDRRAVINNTLVNKNNSDNIVLINPEERIIDGNTPKAVSI